MSEEEKYQGKETCDKRTAAATTTTTTTTTYQ
jgi:hypothetical protein